MNEKIGKIKAVAGTGGIIFEDEDNVWYNPTDKCKEYVKKELKGKTVKDFLDDDITPSEVHPYMYPPEERLNRANIQNIYLSYYLCWDGFSNYTLAKRYGFKELPEPLSRNLITWNNIDDKFTDIDEYMKYIKFGFGKLEQDLSNEIRNGRMSRKEAIELIKKHADEVPDYLDDWLDFIGMTETDFWEITDKFRNPDIWEKINDEWRLKNPVWKQE